MKLLFPTSKPFITQHYGNKSPMYKTSHDGTDFRIKEDPERKILAAADGEVVRALTGSHDFYYFSGGVWVKSPYYGQGSYYGNEIALRHEQDGKVFFTRYGHNEKVLVKVGDKVKAGQHIAKGGNTGLSKGAHLHFMTQWILDSGRHTFSPEPFFVNEIETEFLSDETEQAWKWAHESGIATESTDLHRQPTNEEVMTFIHRGAKKMMEWIDNKIKEAKL